MDNQRSDKPKPPVNPKPDKKPDSVPFNEGQNRNGSNLRKINDSRTIWRNVNDSDKEE